VTCREFADFMMDYLAGELPMPVTVRFEDHLRVCENCQRYLESYRQSISLGKQAFRDLDEAASPEVPESLIQAILSARR
jgi:anti-sigma factor RsiW